MASRQNHSHLGWASIKQSFFLLGLLSTAVIGDYSEFKKLFDASKANLLSSPLGFSDVPGLGGHSQSDDHAQRLQRRSGNLPLIITSFCSETIWPGILTQSGLPPALSGFALDPGVSKRLEVSHDWQGRVWARTNCTFRSDHDDNPLLSSGRACFTGDCGPYVQCKGTGEIPATLAEFAFTSPTGHAYYDISLVDGYNLGMEILSLHQLSGKNAITGISTELTDPVCIGNPSDPSQVSPRKELHDKPRT